MNKRQKKKKMKKEIVKISKIGGKIRKGFQEGLKDIDITVSEAIKESLRFGIRAAEPNIIVTARALARRRRRWN